MRVASEGIPTIIVLLAAAGLGWAILPPAGAALLLLCVLALWFYRDPDRTPPGDSDGWVSPADGRVVEVIENSVDPYAGSATKIGIFMNGLDVHVNRFPTKGSVEEIRYVPGKKWFALEPKASEANERLYVGLMTEEGRTTLVQVAGIMARRIVCKTKVGDTLARGERYGMIKLGSRVDIYLPEGVTPVVKQGDRVRAGESIIGVIAE